MSARKNGGPIDCVAIDLNTQVDFCDARGAFPIANLRQILPALKAAMAWIEAHGVPVVSSLDSHRRWEIERECVPVHCIDGTPGQRKLGFTLMPSHKLIEGDNTLWAPIDIFDSFRQVIFRKRTRDFFANPKADRFLTQLPALEYIVFGVGLENSVKNIVLGLLARNRRVSVIPEACGYWHKAEADLALRQVEAKGAALLTLADLHLKTFPKRRPAWLDEEVALPAPPQHAVRRDLPKSPIPDKLLAEKKVNGHANGNGYSGHTNGNGQSNGHSQRNGESNGNGNGHGHGTNGRSRG